MVRQAGGSSSGSYLSGLGQWSYEVVDTKLAKEPREGMALQLALYSDLLDAIQGVVPELFHVVTPDPGNSVQTYRLIENGGGAGSEVLAFSPHVSASVRN